MILHRLNGCAPTPLAHYLKALGVLRIVSEQLDPDARGWWEGEQFLLASNKDLHELLGFFLNNYAPSAILAPWNKGSGFFYANDPGISPVEHSTARRFAPLRQGIRTARAQLDAMAEADRQVRTIKDEAKDKSLTKAQREALKTSEEYRKRLAEAERAFKRMKSDVMPDLRLDWRGSQREWMDAALVLDELGAARFPALGANASGGVAAAGAIGLGARMGGVRAPGLMGWTPPPRDGIVMCQSWGAEEAANKTSEGGVQP